MQTRWLPSRRAVLSCASGAPAGDRRRAPLRRRSENQLQAELQLAHRGPRAADYSEVASAWNRIAGTIEPVAIEARVRVAPVRMIGEIERLKAELEVLAFSEIKIFESREIPGDQTWSDQSVAPDVAPGAERLQREGSDVEPLSGPPLPPIQGHLLAGGVGAIGAGPCVRTVYARGDGERKARRDREDAADLPAAQQCARNSVVQELPALAEGQVVQHGSHKPVARIEYR